MKSIKLLALASLVCSFPLSLAAQDGGGLKAEIRLISFSSEIPQPEVFIQDPASPDTASVPATIKTYLNHQFSAITLRSRKLALTSKPDKASFTREGELLGEVSLPAGVDTAILLCLPGKADGKVRYQIMPVGDSKKEFPAGSFHVTNLSPVPVSILLEKKKFDFNPGQTILIENPPVRAGGMIGMRATAFINKEWVEVSASLWSHPGRGRGVMIIFQDTATKEIQLKAFDDVPPREKAAAEGAAP